MLYLSNNAGTSKPNTALQKDFAHQYNAKAFSETPEDQLRAQMASFCTAEGLKQIQEILEQMIPDEDQRELILEELSNGGVKLETEKERFVVKIKPTLAGFLKPEIWQKIAGIILNSRSIAEPGQVLSSELLFCAGLQQPEIQYLRTPEKEMQIIVPLEIKTEDDPKVMEARKKKSDQFQRAVKMVEALGEKCATYKKDVDAAKQEGDGAFKELRIKARSALTEFKREAAARLEKTDRSFQEMCSEEMTIVGEHLSGPYSAFQVAELKNSLIHRNLVRVWEKLEGLESSMGKFPKPLIDSVHRITEACRTRSAAGHEYDLIVRRYEAIEQIINGNELGEIEREGQKKGEKEKYAIDLLLRMANGKDRDILEEALMAYFKALKAKTEKDKDTKKDDELILDIEKALESLKNLDEKRITNDRKHLEYFITLTMGLVAHRAIVPQALYEAVIDIFGVLHGIKEAVDQIPEAQAAAERRKYLSWVEDAFKKNPDLGHLVSFAVSAQNSEGKLEKNIPSVQLGGHTYPITELGYFDKRKFIAGDPSDDHHGKIRGMLEIAAKFHEWLKREKTNTMTPVYEPVEIMAVQGEIADLVKKSPTLSGILKDARRELDKSLAEKNAGNIPLNIKRDRIIYLLTRYKEEAREAKKKKASRAAEERLTEGLKREI